jgi:hypothetical protein
LKQPASCLLELGQDKFLVEVVTDEKGKAVQYRCIIADRGKSKNDEAEIRRQLGALVNHLLSLAVGVKEASIAPIVLSARKSRINLRSKETDQNGKKSFSYKVELDMTSTLEPLTTHLDKTPQDGYIILSFVQLQANKASLDSALLKLVQAEEARRANAIKKS